MSKTSPSLGSGAAPESKKRKRSANTVDDLLNCSFAIKPYPSKIPVKSRTLQPLALIPRSCLSLSYLDISSSAKSLGQTRLFEGYIKILELEEQMSSQPTVLIASYEDSKTLCVLERETQGLYALCHIGSWVSLEQLLNVAVASKQDVSKSSSRSQAFSPATSCVPVNRGTSKISHKKRLAIETIQFMVKKSSALPEAKSPPPPIKSRTLLAERNPSSEQHAVSQDIVEGLPNHTSTAEIFETVRTQYFETLYLSKATLAYFAKGPLSRARAALKHHDDKIELKDYIEFLETLIMPVAPIDKKYREGVPNCISLFDIQDHSDEEADAQINILKKRKNGKKLKPGKNGLYPGEDILIRRWWAAHKQNVDSEAPGDNKDGLVRVCISQLRMRETQLQMILILEVLALRPLASSPEENGDEVLDKLLSNEPTPKKQKGTRLKKINHLPELIDLHIDRMCIWQSVALESLGTPSQGSQKLLEIGDGSSSRTNPTETLLRDFCVEVIMPFFSSRLPERCALISRNLGFPIAASSSKPKSSSSTKLSVKPSRPGAATRRPIPAKLDRSLKRVLTDDRQRRSVSLGPNKAIELMKSASMPIMMGIKREERETSILANAPNTGLFKSCDQKSDQTLPQKTNNSALGTHLNSTGNNNRNKIIETELADAISIIKKPNRQLVAKEVVEDSERRITNPSCSKRSKMPTRAPNIKAVQISATPKSHRNKQICLESKNSEEYLPGTLSPTLPSTPRLNVPYSRGDSLSKSSLYSIQATPTRMCNSKNERNPNHNYDIENRNLLSSSPLNVNRSSAQLFRRVSYSTEDDPDVHEFSQGIRETPVKRRIEDLALVPSLMGSGSCKVNYDLVETTDKKENSNCIYRKFGWDDDLD